MRVRDIALWGVGLYAAYKLFESQQEDTAAYPPAAYPPGYQPYPPGSMPPPPMPRPISLSKEQVAKMALLFLVLRQVTATQGWNVEEEGEIVEQLFVPSLRQAERLGLQSPLSVMLIWGVNFGGSIHPSMRGFDPIGPAMSALSSPMPEPHRLHNAVTDLLNIYERGVVPHPFKVELLKVVKGLIEQDDPQLEGSIAVPQGPTIPSFVNEQTVEGYLKTGRLPADSPGLGSIRVYPESDQGSIFDLFVKDEPEKVQMGFNPNVKPYPWPGQ